jgi:Patched family
MRDYVNELAALPQIGEDAPFCWVRDFEHIGERFPDYSYIQELDLSFNEKLKLALNNPTIREIYGQDIVVDPESGNITASRCLLFLRNLDLSVVNDQIAMLQGQRNVTLQQQINQGLEDWKFFSFDTIFFYWELYAQSVKELMSTIVSGVLAVTLVCFVLIPHWTALFFVCPGIIILYVNFLGQWNCSEDYSGDINCLSHNIFYHMNFPKQCRHNATNGSPHQQFDLRNNLHGNRNSGRFPGPHSLEASLHSWVCLGRYILMLIADTMPAFQLRQLL